jgi:hypothetical protein
MRRRHLVFLLAFLLVVLLTPSQPARAQGIPVFDVSNLQQLVEMTTRTIATLEKLREQYNTIVRISQALGAMDRYRIPAIAITGLETAQFPYGRPWLEGMNGGDPRGTRYFQTTQPLQAPGGLLGRLDPDARRALEAAYATIEITDSVAMMGGHQAALTRGYHGLIQEAIQSLESDVLRDLPGLHQLTAIADKIAAGQLLGRRQEMAANQLLSNTLEQLLARNKRQRDAEATAMNMRLNGLTPEARAINQSLVQGADESLRTWRQP